MNTFYDFKLYKSVELYLTLIQLWYYEYFLYTNKLDNSTKAFFWIRNTLFNSNNYQEIEQH